MNENSDLLGWGPEEDLSLGLKVWFMLEDEGIYEDIEDAYQSLYLAMATWKG